MSKHTPGPWGFTISEPHRSSYSSDPTPSVRTIQIHQGDGRHDGLKVVAHMTANIKVDAEDEANAQLIAAAPELLEALQGLMKFNRHTSEASVAAFDAARKAIAKAEGK